jgi:hypothetical protein
LQQSLPQRANRECRITQRSEVCGRLRHQRRARKSGVQQRRADACDVEEAVRAVRRRALREAAAQRCGD